MKKFIFKLFIILFLSPTANSSEIKKIVEGDLNAKIKIIVYESLTCSHCANFHKDVYPELKNEFIDTGLASIEFRNFPLDMAAFNAAKIAHCKNDGKSEILHYLFDNQDKWVKGNTIEELNKNIKKFIDKSAFKLEATPTLIINGEKFDNPTNYKKLKKFLEKLI